eukprot:90291_1
MFNSIKFMSIIIITISYDKYISSGRRSTKSTQKYNTITVHHKDIIHITNPSRTLPAATYPNHTPTKGPNAATATDPNATSSVESIGSTTDESNELFSAATGPVPPHAPTPTPTHTASNTSHTQLHNI